MTNHTKSIYEGILKEYLWDAIRQAATEDVMAFESSMINAERELPCGNDLSQEDCSGCITMSQAILLLNLNSKEIDKYWEIEKEIIEQKYKDRISKLNKIQKELLFKNLKTVWKDDFQIIRYKYALLVYTNMINDYQRRLKKSQEENQKLTDEIEKFKDLNIPYIEEENKQLDKEIETTRKRIVEVREEIQKLENEHQQILNNFKAMSK